MKKLTLVAVLFVAAIGLFASGTTKAHVQSVAYEEGPGPLVIPVGQVAFEEVGTPVEISVCS